MYSGNQSRYLDYQPSAPVNPQPFLSLTLTPQQLPETSLVAERGGWANHRQRSSGQNQVRRSAVYPEHPEVIPYLRLCPGEPSQILAQVHNQSVQSWRVRFGVSTGIPANWCRLPGEEYDVPGVASTAAGDNMMTDVEIPFQVSANFFERHDALQPDNQPLQLDYDGQIQIYARPDNAVEGSEQLMATAPFKVLVRSHSRYLDYLPQVYREVDLIGRLLKIFEQSFDPSIETLKLLWAYLDPRTAPTNLLPFLAHWVGWPTDMIWDALAPGNIQRQRQIIHHAMDLYRWRGTQRGLRRYLHLYTGLPETNDFIQIENGFKPGFELGIAELDKTAIIGGGRPYHFEVRLRSQPPQISYQDLIAQKNLIHTIISQEKPAFCTYDLHIEEATQP